MAVGISGMLVEWIPSSTMYRGLPRLSLYGVKALRFHESRKSSSPTSPYIHVDGRIYTFGSNNLFLHSFVPPFSCTEKGFASQQIKAFSNPRRDLIVASFPTSLSRTGPVLANIPDLFSFFFFFSFRNRSTSKF